MNLFTDICEELSVENMLKTVNKIASWERLSGSRQEREAFLYLEKKLQEYGYETRLVEGDAYIGLPVKCTFVVNGQPVKAQTHALVESAKAKGALVYCENAAEIEKKDCKGKIIITNGRAVFEIVEPAQRAGATGLVCVQDDKIRECIPSACWGSPTNKDWDLLPVIPVASVLREDESVASMIEQIKSGKELTATLITETDMSWRKIPLLIAEIKAPVNTNRFIQLTGHCDSWYYGAIDNGTSNALAAEVARIAKLHQKELKHNFRIVYYSGHSHGRYAGSTMYVDNFWEDLHDNCVLNVNTDCAGCKGADELAYSIVMPEAKELAIEVVKDITGQDFIGRRCVRNGDQSFWNVGVSSAFASFSRQKKKLLPNGKMGLEKGNTELGPGWHSPEDLTDQISPENLLRDAKIVGEYVMTCLTSPVLPLNYEKAADDINEQLILWQEKAGKEFDLSSSIERVKKLKSLCKELREAEIDNEIKNDTYLKLSRYMVLVNFTHGDPYAQESAAAIDPIPSLSAIRNFNINKNKEGNKEEGAMLDPGPLSLQKHKFSKEGLSERERMATILELTRSRNFINYNLLQAIRLIESVL